MSRYTRLRYLKDDLLINEFDYSYSRNSNITAINEKAEGLDQSKHYSYDALQRLVSATGEARFTYDRLGNRTDHSAEYNLFNQRTTDQKYSYTYDLKGNLTGRTDKTTGETLRLSWNNSNQLVQVQKFEGSPQTLIFTLNYKYGPLKRRIETIYINEENPSNSTVRRFIYDNQNIIAETDENDKFLAFYIHGPGIDNPLAMARDINGDGEFSRDETFYYTRDHLGSIRELLDYNGKVYQRYSYSAYGETTIAKHRDKSENSFVENPYTYTSRELDHRTGFYYYRSRWYNPNTGRFLSTDPIEFEAGDSNLYRYVGNNPISFIDPDGETPVLVGIFISSAIIGSVLYFSKLIFKEASTLAEILYKNNGVHNGYGDAFRHCYASCRLTQEFGSVVAYSLGELNEMRGDYYNLKKEEVSYNDLRQGQHGCERRMDTKNNAIGLGFGEKKGTSCQNKCVEAIQKGSLYQLKR